MSVQDYIAKFEDLTHHCDVREHHSQTITRFVLGLRSKIKYAMITSSHDVDTLEVAFDFALKIDLNFKGLLFAEAWKQCSKCEGHGHYDYQCPLESLHVRIVPCDNIDDLKVNEDVNILPEIISNVENALVDSSTLIIDEVHMSSDSTGDDVDEIVESNIPYRA